jgi:hypothetical protein
MMTMFGSHSDICHSRSKFDPWPISDWVSRTPTVFMSCTER